MESESNPTVMEDDAHVLDIDPRQLARILSGVEPAAEFVDQHGVTLQITAEQLIEAGLTLDALEGAGVVQFEEGSFQESNGSQFYLINGSEEPMLQQEYSSVTEQKSEQAESAPVLKSDDGAPPPPVLSASVPISSLSRIVPTEEDLNDPEKLRILIDETRREIQEKDKRSEEIAKRKELWERRNKLISTALVKTMSFENEKVLPVCLPEAPDIPVANVIVKRISKGTSPPEDATVINLENDDQCYVQVERLTEQQSSPSYPNKDVSGQVVCDRCPRRFPNPGQLKQHQEMVHPHKGAFYCRFCEREVFFPSEANFQSHIRLCHKGMMEREAAIQGVDEIEEEPDWETICANSETDHECIHKCSICRKDFASALLSRQHVQEDHGISDVQRALSLIKPTQAVTYEHRCAHCGKAYSKAEMLEKHSIIHRKPESGYMPFTCRFCGKTFRWNENLQKHLTSHDSQEPVQCPECSQMFSNSTRLDVHYKARHATRGHQFPCTFCLKSFAVKDALTKHMLSHGQWRCNECGKRFADELFLRRHQSTHSAQDFVCDVCEKVYCRPENLSAHRNLHTGEKPYTCTFCSMRFTSRPNWKAHMKWHSSEKQFACPDCNTRFKTKENLDTHVEVHRQRKPFGCNLCHRFFDRLEYLYTHSEGRRPAGRFACTKCDKSFFAEKALQSHARSHERSNPFVCTVCDRSFPTEQRIQVHMKSHVERPELSHLVVVRNSRTKNFVKIIYLESGEQPVDVQVDHLGELTGKMISKAFPPVVKTREEVAEATAQAGELEAADDKATETTTIEESKAEESKSATDAVAESGEPAQTVGQAERGDSSSNEIVDKEAATPAQMEMEIVEEGAEMF
ncbi:zf-H2C2 2 and zf-C2H2 6 and zf-C2H2 and zf-C2H2 4 domain containing protein [Trichuris trichiura]|uniref:Zf-H2C2 2 and zf-C2H2 6 and zf-C2H2 and zf-C2H2 4 domain containing protein n=1 Tax=Trichuris trichiura TaxID=36087 RepID=A0A077YZV5_TRITR|nr:zf-H2C2 2 and zf-C2H2 6 and zf-C2H2 and zf-C2H2 4 domain containing protein [Trichuris trichiura]